MLIFNILDLFHNFLLQRYENRSNAQSCHKQKTYSVLASCKTNVFIPLFSLCKITFEWNQLFTY